MKIAYMFNIFKDFEYHAKIFKMLEEDWVDIYVHVDKKSKIDLKKYIEKYDLKNIHFIKRISVYWGGFTQIQATLNLFKAIKKSNQQYDRIIFMTDNEFPFWSNKKIYNFFEEHKNEEFFSVAKPIPNKWFEYPISRVNTYTFYDSPLTKFFERKKVTSFMFKLQKFQRNVLGISRKLLPFEYYRGHSKFYITQKFMEYILDYVKNNPKDLRSFKHTCCADEVFFVTILMNSNFRNNLNEHMYRTHIWGPIGPIVLDMEHKDLITNNKPMVVAKIVPGELFDYLSNNRID